MKDLNFISNLFLHSTLIKYKELVLEDIRGTKFILHSTLIKYKVQLFCYMQD